METINKLRAECVRYYVDKGYPLDHCEMYVPKDEAEIRRIYGCIQKEKEWEQTAPSNPLGIQFEQDDNP